MIAGIIKREKTESIESKLKNVDDSEKNSTVEVIVDDTFDFITVCRMLYVDSEKQNKS